VPWATGSDGSFGMVLEDVLSRGEFLIGCDDVDVRVFFGVMIVKWVDMKS
jgi:hypothetical protein